MAQIRSQSRVKSAHRMVGGLHKDGRALHRDGRGLQRDSLAGMGHRDGHRDGHRGESYRNGPQAFASTLRAVDTLVNWAGRGKLVWSHAPNYRCSKVILQMETTSARRKIFSQGAGCPAPNFSCFLGKVRLQSR